MTILAVENASFAVGHVPLLDKTSFQLNQGEKIGLIGRNGAGKSSFLKILAGVQKLDDGQLIIQNGLKIVYLTMKQAYLRWCQKVWAACAMCCANIITLVIN